MQSAILYGLSQRINSVTQQLPFNCSSGDCKWDLFESLAVCSVCNNVTSKMSKCSGIGGILSYYALSNPNTDAIGSANTCYSLPNGLFIDNLNGWQFHPMPDSPIHYGTRMTTFGTGNASKTITLG